MTVDRPDGQVRLVAFVSARQLLVDDRPDKDIIRAYIPESFRPAPSLGLPCRVENRSYSHRSARRAPRSIARGMMSTAAPGRMRGCGRTLPARCGSCAKTSSPGTLPSSRRRWSVWKLFWLISTPPPIRRSRHRCGPDHAGTAPAMARARRSRRRPTWDDRGAAGPHLEGAAQSVAAVSFSRRTQ